MADQQGTHGKLRELALFAGAGGGILGGHLLGWRTVCSVERDPYAASVLVARQNDGLLPPFPIWDDVCTFDGKPWRGCVDVVSGGFPCQDISSAGRGAGIEGERSGLWREMARIIGEVRPRFAFVENSPILTSRVLDRVLGDLAAMGYDARWGVLGAVDAGAPHKRDRIWILADSMRHRRQPRGAKRTRQQRQAASVRTGAYVADAMCQRGTGLRDELGESGSRGQGRSDCSADRIDWWARDPADDSRATESGMGRVAHGLAHRVDRLKAIGNGQVPAVAALAWRMLGGQ